MVGEDFMLRSFDFVADPAMKTAYPQIFAEDVEVEFGNPSIEAEFPELAEDIRAKERAAAKIDAEAAVAAMIAANDDKVRSAMQEQFEKRLAESLSGIRESVAEGLREEFAADPAVGGSKAALAKIAEIAGVFAQQGDEVALRDAIRERDLKIGAMKESLDKAVDLARRTTYALVVEQRIGGHPMGERIRKMLGDIASFDSREALQARLEDVATEYDTILTERQQRTQDVHEAEIGELRERIAELEGEVEELEAEIEASTESAETSEDRLRESLEGIARKHTSEIDDLRSQLREAVDTANGYRNLLEQEQDKTQSAQVDAYKARRVSGHTNSSKLLSLLEGVQNENAIDAIVSENGTKNIGASDLQGLRESLKRGRSNPAAMMEEVTAAPSVFRDPMLGGMSANQILELSGIKRVR
jgi:TolA-binding protein